MQLVADTVGNNAELSEILLTLSEILLTASKILSTASATNFFLVLPRKDRMKSPVHP